MSRYYDDDRDDRDYRKPKRFIGFRMIGFAWRTARRLFLLLLLLMLLSYLFLSPKTEDAHFDATAATGIAFTPPISLVPGSTIPKDLSVMNANNALDLVEYKGQYFFAFRTGPSSFSSGTTRLIVLTSPDLRQWVKETEFQMPGSNLREPRFLVFKDKLFLYFFKGDSNPLSFQAQSSYAVERLTPGAWSAPQAIYKPGYVAWRAKARGDTAYLSVYDGKGLYAFWRDRPGEVRLLKSLDGYAWEPISEKPQVVEPGAEEADFEFDEQGNLVAVVRLEMSGSLICTAPSNDIANWTTTYTPYKYDGSLLFRRGGNFYLTSRRNVAGAFNQGMDALPLPLKRCWALFRYSQTGKRTTLFRVDPLARNVTALLDLPSCGDTAYAAITPIDNRSYCLLYCSTPFGARDWSWTAGQLIGSNIYQTVLTFPN